MDKYQVSSILDEIGTLLELQGESPFRCNAYHNGARAIEQLSEDLATVIREERLAEVQGIGSTLREKITTLVNTGKLPYYDELRKKTPSGLLDMLRIQGLGPKRVRLLYDKLGIDTIDKLSEACQSGRVAELKGMGDKTQQKILEGIESLRQMGSRVRIDQALSLANRLIEGLRQAPGIIRMELCGSLRRRRETINDIDILISSNDPGPIMERFVSLPGVAQVIAHGPTKSSIIVHGDGRLLMNADLRIVRDEQFPFALHYFTGSKEHNIAIRQRAQHYGLKLNEYELAGDERRVSCHDEADIFKALDLTYIPPEMRENTGEIAAAVAGELPNLVEADDIQGVFHCHTIYSDGRNSVEEMAEAAKALDLKYLGLADHSQSLTVANGLSPERVRQQQAEIERVNKRLKGLKIFKGIECDILADGRLDYDDGVLATFDYVVASVHSHFKQPREQMTARIVQAIRNPYVTMLGHATGRLLMMREGYQVDLEAVLQAAAETGTMIEINSHPERLDLDWIHCKRAKALGVKLVINPDAHNTKDIALYRYGVDVARRGWLERGDVFNTKSLAEVTKALTARKSK
ncbi:MAG: DNA polymerase/3'-5' exonuclease PolX [Gemmataceae bacterium]